MKSVDYLLIGGSAAGTTAAEVIRGLKPKASITIVTDENHRQYSRVLLPHYIRGKVEREQVFLKKDDWYEEKKIELIKGSSVESLVTEEKKVKLSSGEEISYGKLLISIGGYVNKLKVQGSDLGNILYLRTIEDADKIIEVAKKSKRGVIVGGGFIGLEFASCFKLNGVEDITFLVKEPYLWDGKLNEESAKVLTSVLERNGIKVVTSEEVLKFEEKNSSKEVGIVYTKSGEKYAADVVGVGVGIKSDLSFLDGSGVKINRAIVTNEFLETNIADVYAAGDCAEFHDVLFERQHIMGNWANATSQGRAVGLTMGSTPLRSEGRSSERQGRTVFETASSYSITFFDSSTHSKNSGQASSERGGSCTFIGVTDSDFADKVISRGSVKDNKMTRIFVKKIGGATRIVGATIINSIADVAPLTSAVKGKIDASSKLENLKDSNRELKEILTE